MLSHALFCSCVGSMHVMESAYALAVRDKVSCDAAGLQGADGCNLGLDRRTIWTCTAATI